MNIFQIHEIARNIIYHLDQLVEEDYWKAVEDYKNSGEELDYAYTKCSGTNRALKDKLYEKNIYLADKKEKAFAYQVEIEKILLQDGFAYKKDGREKNQPIWQPDYWGDEDSDDPTNWQSEYSEDPSDSDEDPDYSYLESVEWI
ncbi:hypothetical protein RclHR1_40000002 [Rhizophagus clarus]|uniref:Uncharacterized protein n=1 Tax=Rhizophagus clarus TaxID=94130 RepID=A0A2Z6RRT7_9GLOM|nr:hypothetical protein RclHR1_40000002 [Rhizophagus clarus]